MSSLRSVCATVAPRATSTQPVIPKWFTSQQMATFSQNPHPSDDNISGTVCSLLISDGNREIKLKHLTEMIEVGTFFFALSLTLLWIKEENVVISGELFVVKRRQDEQIVPLRHFDLKSSVGSDKKTS